jgi:hypothetical protein
MEIDSNILLVSHILYSLSYEDLEIKYNIMVLCHQMKTEQFILQYIFQCIQFNLRIIIDIS